jgi:phosphohistidine phosphatase SixA
MMARRLYLVRHACAGNKEDWLGPDDDRPLDPAGRQQAEALARELVQAPITRLLSSPTRRCFDTLRPLSEESGLPIETTDVLSVNSDISSVDDLDDPPFVDGAVLCTHGEVLTRLLEDAKEKRVEIASERDDDDWLLLKGSAWVTELNDSEPRIVHRAPLPVPECPDHTVVEP